MNSAANTHRTDNPQWIKSSHSGSEGGDCVEVAIDTGTIQVRDSKNPHGPALTLTPEAWTDFIRFASRGV
ncbi:DUF397 domain-containing protein [Streptomyces sp. NPDC002055]|uniref:DUF397 domain-containing protein n=1 Tax=Streptomyces sp. NPDC002055 TaxID=3154534 RepID=UPI00332666A7